MLLAPGQPKMLYERMSGSLWLQQVSRRILQQRREKMGDVEQQMALTMQNSALGIVSLTFGVCFGLLTERCGGLFLYSHAPTVAHLGVDWEPNRATRGTSYNLALDPIAEKCHRVDLGSLSNLDILQLLLWTASDLDCSCVPRVQTVNEPGSRLELKLRMDTHPLLGLRRRMIVLPALNQGVVRFDESEDVAWEFHGFVEVQDRDTDLRNAPTWSGRVVGSFTGGTCKQSVTREIS